MPGLGPGIPIREARCQPKRDGRDKPGHDDVGGSSQGRLSSLAALAGWTEQKCQAPQRHDDQRAKQHVRHRPGDAAADQLLDPSAGQPELLHQHIHGDAEMRQDGSDDQRRDRDLHQRSQEAFEHPCLVVAGSPAPDSQWRNDSRSAGGRPRARPRRRGRVYWVPGPAGAASTAAGRAPLRRSSAERTASRVFLSRTASRSGAAAPERRIRLAGSGIGKASSQVPMTPKGSSKATSFGPLSRLALPLRSRSRAGIEAAPVSAIFTAAPSTLASSTLTAPFAILSTILSRSNGVRPLRTSPPDNGRRSSRRSTCSTLMPVNAPPWAVTLTVPASVRVRFMTLPPAPSSRKLTLPLPSRRRSPNSSRRQDSRSTSENCISDLTSAPVSDLAIASDPLIRPL